MTGPKNEQSYFDVAALFDALDVQRRDRGLGIWISSQFVPSESVNWREIPISLKTQPAGSKRVMARFRQLSIFPLKCEE